MKLKHQTTSSSVGDLTESLSALSDELQELKEKMDSKGDAVSKRKNTLEETIEEESQPPHPPFPPEMRPKKQGMLNSVTPPPPPHLSHDDGMLCCVVFCCAVMRFDLACQMSEASPLVSIKQALQQIKVSSRDIHTRVQKFML